jgi:hypothetical protein
MEKLSLKKPLPLKPKRSGPQARLMEKRFGDMSVPVLSEEDMYLDYFPSSKGTEQWLQ